MKTRVKFQRFDNLHFLVNADSELANGQQKVDKAMTLKNQIIHLESKVCDRSFKS